MPEPAAAAGVGDPGTLRVAYIVHKFPKISETFILNEILEMRKKGVQVSVFALEDPGETVRHPLVERVGPVTYLRRDRSLISRCGAHLYWAARRPLKYLRTLCLAVGVGAGIRKAFLLDLDMAVRIDRSRPQRVHAHFGDHAADAALLFHMVSGTRFSFTTHSYDIFRFPPKNYRIKSRLADRHITISEYNKRYLVEHFGVDPGNVRVIHCGVDRSRLEAVAASRAEVSGLLVTVARLHHDKGIDVLARACRLLKDRGVSFRAEVIGDGPERGALERLIAQLGVGDVLTLLGNRTQDEVFDRLVHASCLVLPSRLEGIPVSLMEAMALGVPVITTRICGIPELVRDGENGFLVESEDAEALAERITRLLGDRALRERFVQAARRKVAEEFDQITETDKLLALWKGSEPRAVTMKAQILKNIFSNYAVSVLSMVIGFVIVPFLIHKLGKEAYGLIALTEATIIFSEIATVSVRTALSRHATFTLSQNRLAEFVAYLSTGRYVLFAAAAVVFGVGAVVSLFFERIFQVPPALVMDSRWLFFMITVAVSISIPNIVYWSVLYAKQRFDLINFAMSFGVITRAVALFALFSWLPPEHATLVTYGAVYLVMTWVQNLMTYLFHRTVMPAGTRVRMDRFNIASVKEILSFSVHTSINRLSAIFVGNAVTVLVNLFWGPAMNAIYSIALRLPTLTRRVFTESAWALTPTFTDLVAKNDRQRMEKLFFMYSKLLALVTAPISLTLVFLGPELIRWWVGPEFEVAGQLMIYYSLPLLFGVPFSVCGCINNAYGRVKVPSLVGLGVSTVNVLSGIFMGHLLGMGLFGFALANFISSCVYVSLFGPYYSCYLASISVRRYFMESFVRPLGLALPIMAGGIFGMKALDPDLGITPGVILVLAVLAGTVYGAAYFLILSVDEKKYVNDFVRALRNKLARPAAGSSGA